MIGQLTLLAPGLLGGSVAQAAHARGLARRIVLWTRRPEARERLRTQPWCDAVADTPGEAVAEADLVVLAAPVDRIIELAQTIASRLPPGALVTDVGSVKGRLTRQCHEALAPRSHFVGAHPMAGSEKTGWENATPTLFVDRVCFVTPLPETDETAVTRVANFWKGLGSIVASVPPETHDEIVAHISHLPQALATTLCTLLAQQDPGWGAFAGGGLRDTTRIAGSDASMWIEIFSQNRDPVLRALERFQSELQGFHDALSRRDWPEIRARLERGRDYRQRLT